MNKQAIANTLKSLQKTMRKHSPAILTGIGIAGMAAAAVMAVRATPKALRMVDDREIEDGKRLTTSEIVKTTWKCYIPAAVTGVCSAACIIGASSISARRNAALVTAYTISETALKEYKDKAVEVVGPKKEQAIRDAVAKEQLEQAGVPERKFIPTGRGETPCFDPLTNACFKSDYRRAGECQIRLPLSGISGHPGELWILCAAPDGDLPESGNHIGGSSALTAGAGPPGLSGGRRDRLGADQCRPAPGLPGDHGAIM